MSDPVSRQPLPAGSARGEPSPGRPPEGVPAQDPRSPIEREIARSERASAALAATRALARAAVADSQVSADSAEDDPRWVRTQYSDFDHSLPAEADPVGERSGRSAAGGSFDPGIATGQGRAFPGAAMADVPSRTRTGAQARFRPESRQAPRDARPGAKAEPPVLAHRLEHDGRRDLAPMRAMAASGASSRAPAPARAGLKTLLVVGLGAVVVLAGAGLAWKARQASHGVARGTAAAIAPAPLAATTAQAPLAVPDHAPAEAARLPSLAPPEAAVAPASAAAPTDAQAPVDVPPAAEVRAAAVPSEAASAAEPTSPEHALPAAAATPGTGAASHRKVDIAAAIANAQAKAERFLSSGSAAASAPTAGEGRQAP